MFFLVSSDCVIRYVLSCRDGRYVVPRPASADEQHRVPQYNHMMTSRNVPQPNLTPSGALPAADRGSRLLPGVSGMGIGCGVTRSMPMTRPGFQGIASSSMVSSGSMHSGVGSGQGNSMLRPREPMHTMRVCSYIPSNLLGTYFYNNIANKIPSLINLSQASRLLSHSSFSLHILTHKTGTLLLHEFLVLLAYRWKYIYCQVREALRN